MKAKRAFPKGILTAIRDGKILGIRAGTKPYRIIGIWAVVVEGRVFVRSWSLKPRKPSLSTTPRGLPARGPRLVGLLPRRSATASSVKVQ